MGRPERPLDPTAGPVAALALQLRELRENAGRPSYAALARRAHLSQTTLSEAAGGQRLPTWETVAAYVSACGDDPALWRERWNTAAAEPSEVRPADVRPADVQPAEIQPVELQRPATTEPAADHDPARHTVPPAPNSPAVPGTTQVKARRRLPWVVMAVATVVLAAVVGMVMLNGPSQSKASATIPTTPTTASVAPTPPGVPSVAVADGADPKDSGCALDPAVVTLDSTEVDLYGQPAGLNELRYSPRCGVAWPRFDPFPKAAIPTGAVIHVDVVRPAANNLRLPFQARYVGAPVYGNVMRSTEQCVFAAASIQTASTGAVPESRTHCFRGSTPVISPVGDPGVTGSASRSGG
jgi:hypothetical protein